jgi:hypothetical protein
VDNKIKKIDTLLTDLELLSKAFESIENFDPKNLGFLKENLKFIEDNLISKYVPTSSSQAIR